MKNTTEQVHLLGDSLQQTIRLISAKRKEINFIPCELCGEKELILYDSAKEGKKICRACLENQNEEEYKQKEAKKRADMLRAEKEYRKININAYLQKAGVGRRYIESTLENFKGGSQYVSFLKNWIQAPCSLYIFGACGCGKTHLSSALCREVILSADRLKKKCIPTEIKNESEILSGFYSNRQCFEDKSSTSVFFINAQELFLQIRSTFDKKAETQISEQEIVDFYSWQEFLFIDDMGADKTSEWSRATMYTIIDRRDREMLPTVITSNLSPAEIGKAIDSRISSRVSNGKIIEIKMPDYRLKR